jgi:hypothetical protein
MPNTRTRKISQLNRDPLAAPDLAGGLLEMSLPKGPVAGGYVSFAISYEQFTADLAGGSYTALTLAAAKALPAADPPGVVPGMLYGITGKWNGATTNSTVYVHGVKLTAFHRLGVIYDAQGVSRLVQVDVAAGTYAVADFVWEYVGDPANRNVSLGVFDASNTLGDFPFQNTFGANMYACAFGDGLANNTFGNTQINVTAGGYFFGNVLGVECSDCRFGDFNGYNQLGAQVQTLTTGNACNYNVFAPSVKYVQLGDGVKNCIIGAGCNAVKLGNYCERVELYNCGGAGYTSSAPFTVPDGTTDAIYRNNVLQTGSAAGGGPGLPTFDLLDLTTDQMDEVMALQFTNADAPLAATPAWTKPGHSFDATYPNGSSYHFYAGRGNYTPATAGSGVGPRWSRTPKL